MKKTIWEKMGIRVKEARHSKKLTQEQLAAMSGLERDAIAKIETGYQGCSMESFIRIINILECSADFLLADYIENLPIETEISNVLAGCSHEELSILLRTLTALRKILKDYTVK